MKKLIALSLFSVSFIACDKVKEPNPPVGPTALVDTTKLSVVTKSVTNNNFKKVLIEDYTGHKCGNCPAAATEAESIKLAMGDSAVIVAVHAGFFAKTDLTYPTSYTTAVGNAWDGSTGFDVGAFGNPNGMVNRIGFSTTNHIKGYTTWRALAKNEVKKSHQVKIDLKTKYDPDTKGINVYASAQFKQNLSGNYYLNIVYFEDGIVGKQKYYQPAPGKDSVGYVFNHVLKGEINGNWGEQIANSPLSGTIVSKKYLNIALSNGINDNKTHIVAFVYDNTTKEIIQVEETKIR
jgi:hypothetical protein